MKRKPNADDVRRYDDILSHPHPVSERHPPMPRRERAAQFAPFAALTGLGAAINETARQTERRIEPGGDLREELDHRLRRLQAREGERPPVTVTFFRPDESKTGGRYETVSGHLRRIDPLERTLLMTDGQSVALDDILSLEDPDGEALFDYLP